MRTLPVGVVVSAAAHLAAAAWFATHEPPDEPAPEAEPITVDIVPAPPPPPPAAVDVALLDGAGLAAPRGVAAGALRGRASIGIGRAATFETDRVPSGSPLMKMRSGAPDLRHLTWVPSFDPDAVPLPAPVKISGELQSSANGRHTSDQGGFAVSVDRDGAAHISDNPSVDIHFTVPSPKQVGHSVADWYEAPKGVYGETAEHPMTQHVQVDDTGDHIKQTTVSILGGAFNLDDLIMRRTGVDPYASRKLHVLDATRDERAEIGSRHRAEQLKKATQIMHANLDRLWATVRDPAARKQALFELWDECAETGDPKLVEAGADARRLVVGFIRARLPAGSADAYTAAELGALNRKKQSKAPFQPYD